MFFFLLRRMKKIPNAIAMRTATPPIVPPTIAPTGVEDELWVGVGVEDADVDVVEKITGVGLGVGVVVGDAEAVGIVILTNTKEAPEATDVPASVAVAYIVSIDGIESQ